MTIHAFCRRLLATHPLAAGLDPAFRVLDAGQAGRLPTAPSARRSTSCSLEGDERVAQAAAEYQPWRLAQMTLAAHERLRSQGMAEPRLPEVGDPVHSPGKREEQFELAPPRSRLPRSMPARRSRCCSSGFTVATRS